MAESDPSTRSPISRRDFIAKTTALSGAALAAGALARGANGRAGRLRIGWVGAGSRGAYDLRLCLEANPGAELVAVADLFQDQVDRNVGRLREEFADRVKVGSGTTFLSFDGYRRLLEMDEVDLVVLTSPPGFRPKHFKAAVRAGKHIFMEKPGAVDPVGVRSIIQSAEEAERKGLVVQVGMQQRYMPQYVEIIDRVRRGDIGEVTHVGAYWLGTMQNWHWSPRQPEWTDVEYQIRTWPHWLWLSGDCCVEQLVHNLDISNWALGRPPESCRGLGGRIVRNGPEYGNIYDHFSFDYDYGGGVKGLGMNAQIEGISNKVMNTITGTEGEAWVSRSGGAIKGSKEYRYQGEADGSLIMMQAMFDAIRVGEPLNNGKLLAEATLTGILGRTAAYTGRSIGWKWLANASKEDLSRNVEGFGPLDEAPPAVPGKTLPV